MVGIPLIRTACSDTGQGRQQARDAGGFTAVEMLIAIAVVALLAAAAVPFVRPATTAQLSAAAQALRLDLQLARNVAIQTNASWRVQFDLRNNVYTLSFAGSGQAIPFQHPLTGELVTTYRVDVSQLGTQGLSDNGVRLAAAILKETQQSVTEVTFTGVGGTAPARTQDTVIWLSQGTGADTRYVRLTVGWVTGQVWAEPPASTLSLP